MAEFAAVTHDILEDDEYLELRAEFQLIWLTMIISRAGGKCGIYKFGFHALESKCGYSREVITDALNEFGRLGWVERDGDYIWIRSRIKHRSYNNAWFQGALAEARSMLDKTALAQRCIELYVPDRPGIGAALPESGAALPEPMPGVGAGHKQSKAKQSKAQIAKQSKEDSVSNETGAVATQPARKPRETDRKKVKPAAPPPENCAKLADRICGLLDKARADGLTVINQRTQATLARFIERSGFDPQLLGKAWLWGWHEERGYWKTQMLNMASWGQKQRWQHLVNQYQVNFCKGIATNQPTEISPEDMRAAQALADAECERQLALLGPPPLMDGAE